MKKRTIAIVVTLSFLAVLFACVCAVTNAEQPLARNRISHTQIKHLEYTSDGSAIAIGGSDEFVLWNVAEKRKVLSFQDWNILAAISQDATIVVTLAPSSLNPMTSRAVRLNRTTTGEVLRSFEVFGDVSAVDIFPKADLVAIGTLSMKENASADKAEVQIWDIGGTKIKAVLENLSAPANVIRFSPDGTSIVTGGGNGEVLLWDVASGRSKKSFHGHQTRVTCLEFSPNGKNLLSRSTTETKMWNLESGRETISLDSRCRAEGGARSIAFHRSGRLFALIDEQSGTIQLRDVNTGQSRATIRRRAWCRLDQVHSIRFSPDGTTLSVGVNVGDLERWDVSKYLD